MNAAVRRDIVQFREKSGPEGQTLSGGRRQREHGGTEHQRTKRKEPDDSSWGHVVTNVFSVPLTGPGNSYPHAGPRANCRRPRQARAPRHMQRGARPVGWPASPPHWGSSAPGAAGTLRGLFRKPPLQ